MYLIGLLSSSVKIDMPAIQPLKPNDDHDQLIQLGANMVSLSQHVDLLVDSLRETHEMTRETQKMLQDHSTGTHATTRGTLELVDHRLRGLEEFRKDHEKSHLELEKIMDEQVSNWKVIRAAAVVLVPIFTGITILVVKLFFHL